MNEPGSKTKMFFRWGLIAPLLIIILFSNLAYSLSPQDYWSFYEKYISDLEFLSPYLEENCAVSGSQDGGFTFVSKASLVFAYNDSYISYWKFIASGILFHVEDLPIVTFKFKFIREELKSVNESIRPDVVYPILTMTHLHGEDMLVLQARVNPGSPGTTENDEIFFWWARIRFDPSSMETKVENLNVTEGSGTYLLLDPGTVWNNYVRISIIPAVYSEKKVNQATNETYYHALFGFYTIVDLGTAESGFAVAWRTLKFTSENLTDFQRWLRKFMDWWIYIGVGYFARTSSLTIEFIQPNSYLADGSYVEIHFKEIGVYNARIDVHKYYNDLVTGILPEYNYTNIVDMTTGAMFSFDPSRLTLVFIYVSLTIIPSAILRRRYSAAATALSVILNAAFFYILLNDLAFIVLGALLIIMMLMNKGVESLW